MVSGLVTSPEDHSRICFAEARPIRIASKSLMSINASAPVHAERWWWYAASFLAALFDELEVGDVPEAALALLVLLVLGLGREVVLDQLLAKELVVGDGQLPVLVVSVEAL